MAYNPNPIHKNGSRNVFCPYYDDCLSHAARLHWESFTCFECRHQMMHQSGVEGPFLTGDTSPYYTISSEVFRKVG